MWSRIRRVPAILAPIVLPTVVAILLLWWRDGLWFSIFTAVAVALALYLPWQGVRQGWRAPYLKTLLLLGVVALCAIAYLYSVIRQRQPAERMSYVGVALFGRDTVRLGVGEPGLDVHLESSPTRLDEWSVAVVRPRMGDSVLVVPSEGVELIERWETGRRLFLVRHAVHTPIYGAPVVPDAPVEVVRDGRRSHLTLRRVPHWAAMPNDMALGALEWDGARAELFSGDDVLHERLERRLRAGISLAELRWSGPVDRQAAEDLILTRTTSPDIVLPFPVGRHVLFPDYRLVSRRVDRTRIPQPQASGAPLRVAYGDTIEVRSGGTGWRFALERRTEVVPRPDRRRARLTGLLVRFIRNPDPAPFPMPAPEDCTEDEARCIPLASARPFPPPRANIRLDEWGLDSARYGLLARFELHGERVLVATPDTTLWARMAESFYLPARVLRHGEPPAGYVLRASAVSEARMGNVLGTSAALLLLLFSALGLLALRSPAFRRTLVHPRTSDARAAWALLAVFLWFLAAKLVLGLRVAYVEPRNDRTAEVAIGAWIMFALLLLAGGLWDRFRRGLPRRPRAAAEVGAGAELPTPGFWRHAPAKLPFGRAVELLFRGGFLFAVGWLVVLGRAEPLLYAVVCTGLVLALWLVVDAIFRGPAGPERHPLDALSVRSGGPEALRRLIAAIVLAAGMIASSQVGWWIIVVALPVAVLAEGRLVQAARSRPLLPVLGVAAALLATAAVVMFFLAAKAGPTVTFGLVFLVLLLGLRGGSAAAAAPEPAPDAGRATRVLHTVSTLYLPIALPLVGLGVLAFFDFGLGLVFFFPLLATALLATGLRTFRLRHVLAVAATIVLVVAALGSVLWPDIGGAQRAGSAEERATAFANVGNRFVRLLRSNAQSGKPLSRAIVRGIAARDPTLLERAMVFSGRNRMQLEAQASREQVWGARMYAASGGLLGNGIGSTMTIGRGVPKATSDAENTFAVFVLSEHGAIGGWLILFMYAAPAAVAALWLLRRIRHEKSLPQATTLAAVVGGCAWLAFPAAYVALSNLGPVPLTGQNMPMLGLNSWADDTLFVAVGAVMILALVRPRDDAPAAWFDLKAHRPLLGTVAVVLASLVVVPLLWTAAAVRENQRVYGDAAARGLHYDDFVDELSLTLAGPEPLLAVRHDTVRLSKRVLETFDTLAIVADTLLFPGFEEGTFLHDQVDLYNRFQRRRAELGRRHPELFAATAELNPSVLRTARLPADTLWRVSASAASWNLRVPAIEQRWEGDVLTRDHRRSLQLVGLSDPAIPLDRSWARPLRVRGGRVPCAFGPAPGPAKVVEVRCRAAFTRPQLRIVLKDSLRARSAIGGYGGVRVDGRRLAPGEARDVADGSIFSIEPLPEPLVLSLQQLGVLSTWQWENGMRRRVPVPHPALDALSVLGRFELPVDGETERPIVLSPDAELSAAIVRSLRAKVDSLPDVRYAMVLLADAVTGEVLALAEARGKAGNEEARFPGRSELFERQAPGSMVKPILAAAVLSARPELATLRIAASPGSQVHSVLGMPAFRRPFESKLCGDEPPGGWIDLRYYIRCSVNEYAAALLLAGLSATDPATGRVRLAPRAGPFRPFQLDGVVERDRMPQLPFLRGTTRVPYPTLAGSDVAEALDTLFSVTADVRAQTDERRTSAIWRGLAFAGGDTIPVDIVPRELRPTRSSPSLVDPDELDTPHDLLARYSFGAWVNTWTPVDLVQSFARIVTSRRTELRLTAAPVRAAPPPMTFAAQGWYPALREALADVPETGTASGLAAAWRALGVPGRLYAKTGTLNEEGWNLHLRGMLFGVGASRSAAALDCGVVGIVYFRFSGRSPAGRPHVDYMTNGVGPALKEYWNELGVCPVRTGSRPSPPGTP
ncbi:MAG TPA: hypothetical protein VFQ38_11545 [Longimicrobiales bacterium]|nr:hypothetical protein [Longimicrobiales bacterium]